MPASVTGKKKGGEGQKTHLGIGLFPFDSKLIWIRVFDTRRPIKRKLYNFDLQTCWAKTMSQFPTNHLLINESFDFRHQMIASHTDDSRRCCCCCRRRCCYCCCCSTRRNLSEVQNTHARTHAHNNKKQDFDTVLVYNNRDRGFHWNWEQKVKVLQ